MRQERERLYEGMYIINTNLSEDARKKAIEKITDSIEQKKGKIHIIHEMGKRRLAYEIEKKREGFYFVIYFSIASTYILELTKEYQLHEDLIRYMTIKADKVLELLEFKPLIKQS